MDILCGIRRDGTVSDRPVEDAPQDADGLGHLGRADTCGQHARNPVVDTVPIDSSYYRVAELRSDPELPRTGIAEPCARFEVSKGSFVSGPPVPEWPLSQPLIARNARVDLGSLLGKPLVGRLPVGESQRRRSHLARVRVRIAAWKRPLGSSRIAPHCRRVPMAFVLPPYCALSNGT